MTSFVRENSNEKKHELHTMAECGNAEKYYYYPQPDDKPVTLIEAGRC